MKKILSILCVVVLFSAQAAWAQSSSSASSSASGSAAGGSAGASAGALRSDRGGASASCVCSSPACAALGGFVRMRAQTKHR